MNDLINKIFNSYNYIKISGIGNEKIEFYKHKSAKIANYFLVNTIDCRRFEDDEEKVINALEQLEYEYSKRLTSNGVSLKQRIIESFDDIKEASQVDKNISAIYLLLFKDIEKINNYRNVVYSIEESPNYFKRYVLPYTQKQTEQLNLALSQYGDRSLVDALCQIVDNEDNYFELVEGKDLNSTYGLVVRMFSKIPFLQYKFKTELAPDPIEIQIERNLNKDLISYHSFLDKTSSKFLDYLFISRQMAISLGF